MPENIDWKFDLSCAARYDMDSDEVDAALAKAGLDRNCTIEQAQRAVREYASEHYYAVPLPPWV